MPHRKWRESKQQVNLSPDMALIGCCSVSLISCGELCLCSLQCTLLEHPVLAVSQMTTAMMMIRRKLVLVSLLFSGSLSPSLPPSSLPSFLPSFALFIIVRTTDGRTDGLSFHLHCNRATPAVSNGRCTPWSMARSVG